MARIKAKQITEFQDVGTGSNGITGQYLSWNATAGKYELSDQPLDGQKGQKGAQGAKGDKGNTGQRGDDWSSGGGGPITPGEQEGDHYLDTETGNVYYWSGSAWEFSGNIQGPQGDKGSTGAKGDTGAQGAKGDTGAQGAKGDTGAQGQKGEAGADGATGAAGLTGATGPQGQKGDTGSDATISNAGNNRVVTSDGTVGGLYAESNFTYTAQGGGVFDVAETNDIDFAFGESASHFRVNAGPHIGTNARLFGVESNDTNYGLPTVIVDPTMMLTDGIDGSWWPVIWDSTNGALGYQVSSRQFKRDIQPIDINIDLLFDKVNAVEYKFIDDDSDRVQVGFIAEEVEEWDPRFVLHDAEGNPRSLDYGRMVPALFEAIKDLRARIEILENKNN
jgi:hypothetical protein